MVVLPDNPLSTPMKWKSPRRCVVSSPRMPKQVTYEPSLTLRLVFIICLTVRESIRLLLELDFGIYHHLLNWIYNDYHPIAGD